VRAWRLLGVGTIQLRAKNLNDADALQIVSDALEVIKAPTPRLVVTTTGARDRGRRDASASRPGRSRRRRPQRDQRGQADPRISTHDDAELAAALAVRPVTSRWARSSRHAEIDCASRRRASRRSPNGKAIGDIPLVAIGGIKLEHASEISPPAPIPSPSSATSRRRRPGCARARLARPQAEAA